MKTSLIVTAVGLVALLVTNPSQDDYVDWLRQKVGDRAEPGVARAFALALAEPMIRATTTRQNYGLFSVYETAVGEKPLRAVGLFHTFFIPSGEPINSAGSDHPRSGSVRK